MSKIPAVNARLMIQFLASLGFEKVRHHGSHSFFRHPDGGTVPVHPGEDLGRGLTNKILHDADVTRQTFLSWLEKKKS